MEGKENKNSRNSMSRRSAREARALAKSHGKLNSHYIFSIEIFYLS